MSHKALILPSELANWEVGTVPTGEPGKGEILVKVYSAALNPIDWKVQRDSNFSGFVQSYPVILGEDSAGIVEEVGEGVSTFKKGDKVFHAGDFTVRAGTFQQYAIVPAEIVAKIPDGLSFDEAAAIPLGLATAAVGFYHPPEKIGLGLKAPWEGGEGQYRDQGIMIFGGSSSVGQYAIQLAKWSGFSPIVTTASLHNSDYLKTLGATHVIDRKADVVVETKKIFTTPPKVVYDAISTADTQEQAWQALAPGGTLVLVLPPTDSLKAGQDGKIFIHIYGNAHVQRELGVSLYAHLTEILASKKIIPNKVEVLPNGLDGIIGGLKRMEENKVSGVKLIARPQEN